MKEIKGIEFHTQITPDLQEKIESSDIDGIDENGVIHCFTSAKYNEAILKLLSQIK
jgi:hypothetical protein